MESFSKRKYKDEVPLNTINKIRNTLSELGLLSIETGWQNSAEGFYSVNLKIAGTNIATNGKGTTNQYALASGYGEMMERLQNQSFFRLNADLSPDAFAYQGFHYTPDEKQFTIDELLNSEEEWITKQFERVRFDMDKKELLKKWKKVSYEDTPSDFTALPYLNLSSNQISHIPIKMITKMYMSNGMCGGNTYEEALVQGLSEVFERHANKEIIRRKITPPTISKTYLEKFPRITNMISQIESSGNYEVIVKDCSLGEGYPVIGVMYINRDDQTYFIKFGSHPMFESAIERTLTELLQGQDVRKMMGVEEYEYKLKIEDEDNNIIGILVNGSGLYPAEIFSPKFSYDFEEFESHEANSNKEMLKYYLNLLREKDLDCFVRDVSFLGFPSFHVIVPDLSEIDTFDDLEAIDSYGEYNKVKRYIRNLEKLEDDEIENILEFFMNTKYSSQASITQLLNLPVKSMFPWYYVSIDLFITALHMKKGNYEKAYDAMSRFINSMPSNHYKSMERTYYKCARDYIGTKIDNLELNDAISHLSAFYLYPLIQGVISDFGNPNEILKSYGQLVCFDCDQCDLKGQCLYKETEKVYRVLKGKLAQGSIEQSSLIKKLNL